MDRKSFSSVMDEVVGKLESDVRVLKNQQATLTINLKELEAKRDKLSKEIMDGETRLANINQEYKEQVDNILKNALTKLNDATKKDSEASIKLAELKDKIAKSDNLIKSTQGARVNLEIEKVSIDKTKEKLNSIVDLIKKTLE